VQVAIIGRSHNYSHAAGCAAPDLPERAPQSDSGERRYSWIAYSQVDLAVFVLGLGGLSLFAIGGQAAPLVNSLAFPSGGIINYNVCCDVPGTSFLTTGDFITFYDAGGPAIDLGGDIANPLLFAITTNLTDTPAPGQSPTDNPTITNLRFTYIGGPSLNDANLGTFSLLDPSNGYRVVAEDGTAHTNAGSIESAGTDIAPALAATPEPSAFIYLGMGVLSIVGVARRKRTRAAGRSQS
jgi:hypothetical protein